MKLIKKCAELSLLLITGATSVSVMAADQNTGRNLAATCALCHGTDGKGGEAFPALAGQDKATLVMKLKDYKAGKGSPTIMHQISKGFADEQIELMAAYFAAQR